MLDTVNFGENLEVANALSDSPKVFFISLCLCPCIFFWIISFGGLALACQNLLVIPQRPFPSPTFYNLRDNIFGETDVARQSDWVSLCATFCCAFGELDPALQVIRRAYFQSDFSNQPRNSRNKIKTCKTQIKTRTVAPTISGYSYFSRFCQILSFYDFYT